MMPGVITMTNLQPMKAGKVDVTWQPRAAGEVVHAPSTNEPDRHIGTRRQRLQCESGFVAQPWRRRVDIERRERSVEVRQYHQMSSWRPGVDRRKHLRHHLGIVVTQPIHATSTARTSTVQNDRSLGGSPKYSGTRPG